MITKIGIVAGKILELLDKRNRVLVFGEVHADLKEPRDLVLMSLGWLLHEGHVYILKDPLREVYVKAKDKDNEYTSEASMFDLIVGKDVSKDFYSRIKNMIGPMDAAAENALILLEGCGGLLSLKTIECHLNEHREIILMSLGWLIRKGAVRGIPSGDQIFILQLPKATARLDLEALCHV